MAGCIPRNKTIWVVVEVESDFEVENVDFLNLDVVFFLENTI